MSTSVCWQASLLGLIVHDPTEQKDLTVAFAVTVHMSIFVLHTWQALLVLGRMLVAIKRIAQADPGKTATAAPGLREQLSLPARLTPIKGGLGSSWVLLLLLSLPVC